MNSLSLSHSSFEQIVSLENLFSSWEEFKRGKMYKLDVAQFATNIEQEIFTVHKKLQDQIYVHTTYTSFTIHDPKNRTINKACVRDRLIHHALVRVLQPLFEPTFIHHSYSSRKN